MVKAAHNGGYFMRRLLGLLAALAMLQIAAPAKAQTVYGQTVSVCGVTVNSPVVGNVYPLTTDTYGQMCVEGSYLYQHISTGTTTTVKSTSGVLHTLAINTCVASATVTIYDNTAASGTIIGVLTCPSTITGITPETTLFDLRFATGLTIVTSGATDVTATYR